MIPVTNRSKVFNLVICAFLMFLTFSFSAKAEGIFKNYEYYLPLGKDMLLYPSSKANYDYDWYTDDSQIASVNLNGIVHSVKCGETAVYAVNKSNGEVSRCVVKILPMQPVRCCYSASGSVIDKNTNCELVALSHQNVSEVKFELVNGRFGSSSECHSCGFDGDLKVWKQSVYLSNVGDYRVNVFAKSDDRWVKCDELGFNITVSNPCDCDGHCISKRCASSGLIDFVSSCEGFVSKVYLDVSDYLTIGYGELIHPFEPFYNNLSKTEANAKLINKINGRYASALNNFFAQNKIHFTQCQFDALLSFCYNLGTGWMYNNSHLAEVLKNCSRGEGTYYGYVKSSNGLNIRCLPDVKSKKIGALRNNTKIKLLQRDLINGEWYHIATDSGKEGYCFAKFLNVVCESSSYKHLDNVDRNEFINIFLKYHHSGCKCYPGLLARRCQELDMFFCGTYQRFKAGNFRDLRYNLPDCAKKAFGV